MQERETTNGEQFADVFRVPPRGRILAIDPGTKKTGVAVCDELQLTVRRVGTITAGAWKTQLKEVIAFLEEFDARALVIGLPLNSDGSESEMSRRARRMAARFRLSTGIPVILQDERATSHEARGNLWSRGASRVEAERLVDAEAAAIILTDFLQLREQLLNRSKP